jgi:hypothetical protein
VTVRLTIFRFLSVLAVCGLIVAPIGRPVAAMTPAQINASDMASTDMAMDGMAEDMPCCPKKMPRGCADCPAMSLCQSGTIVSLPGDSYLIAFSNSARVLVPLNQADLAGQAQGPPRRPPKV